jgi:hypothetical protein
MLYEKGFLPTQIKKLKYFLKNYLDETIKQMVDFRFVDLLMILVFY